MMEFIENNLGEIGEQTIEHLWLSGLSILLSGFVGIGLGLTLTRTPRAARLVLGFTGIVQTVPSLAMLGLFIPLLGIGQPPAILALFLYALLPIVRNTYTGVQTIDPHVREAALAMGMTSMQLLRLVELPLALPVIFAGVRTAAVINVGVATLCALVGAGGLGEFIFRGITLNQAPMILAGAIPASLLAITLDYLLSVIQSNVRRRFWPFLAVTLFLTFLYPLTSTESRLTGQGTQLLAGFNSEFMNREDGWPGLKKAYDINMPTVELEITLMYEALRLGEVDVIAGFTTDGRIQAYDFRVLHDDRHYFPPYQAVPLVKQQTLQNYPLLEHTLARLQGTISETLMARLNLAVDSHRLSVEAAADTLLRVVMSETGPVRKQEKAPMPRLVVGSKAFTENYILATFLARYVEATTPYSTDLILGFGGTKLLFDAFVNNDVHLYPEYSGTAWLVFLQPPADEIASLMSSPQLVFAHTNQGLNKRFGAVMLPSLGFNNTTALIMRRDQADSLHLETISDLKNYINRFED